MKNDSHSILWIPGIKLRVVNIGPQAWQQGPLLAQPPPPHHPDYTQFCFFYSSPGLSLSFLTVPKGTLCFCSSLQWSTGHTAFYSESYYFVCEALAK